ncbi:MAG: hypothetical protein WBA77_01495 [Microcoleaceae cyanobacterium]
MIQKFFKENLLGIFVLGILTSLTASAIWEGRQNDNRSITVFLGQTVNIPLWVLLIAVIIVLSLLNYRAFKKAGKQNFIHTEKKQSQKSGNDSTNYQAGKSINIDRRNNDK